ncbi:MAG: ATP-binding protein [Sulfitobacter sp.]
MKQRIKQKYCRDSILGRRLIVQILAVNLLLSVVASAAQLTTGYFRDRAQIFSVVDDVSDSFHSGFERALWEYNFELVDALIDGIITKPDVEFVRIKDFQGQVSERGVEFRNMTTREVVFTHTKPNGEVLPLGNLTIGISTEQLNKRVLSQLWTLLLSNFAKTILASIAMLALFERNVGRHLRKLALHFNQTPWPQHGEKVRLDRKEPGRPDALNDIVDAIHKAKQQSIEDIRKLNEEIEKRKKVENLLTLRTSALEDANREQAEFTYAISHDLKSPANTVRMLLNEFRISEMDNLSSDGLEILQDAEQTTARMTALVEDVLSYARTVEDGMVLETVDLEILIQEITEDLKADIIAANAELNHTGLRKITGNKAQIRLLLQNLISNAIKFHAPDIPPVITLSGRTIPGSGSIEISVQDNGIGISEEYHQRVFGLFQRLHSFESYEGSGLGLTLCKRIVTNHGGTISVSSVIDEGSRFTVVLPTG